MFPRLRTGTLLPSLCSTGRSKPYSQTHSQGIEIQSSHFVEEKTAKSSGKEHDDKKRGRPEDTKATHHQNNCILFKNVL